jgi:excisionase family DNA binding protein
MSNQWSAGDFVYPRRRAMNEATLQNTASPLLERLLLEKQLQLKGIYTNRDAAEIFGVSTRTIQDWVREGKLRVRDLPGRGRFLSADLELFLQQSVKCQPRGDS